MTPADVHAFLELYGLRDTLEAHIRSRRWAFDVGWLAKIRPRRNQPAVADGAADLASEAYLAAWERWPEVPKDQDKAFAWLVARANLVANRERRKMLAEGRVPAKPPVFEAECCERSLADALRNSIDLLDGLDRAVVEATLAGLTQTAIAAKFGISQPTVSRRLRKAAEAIGYDMRHRAADVVRFHYDAEEDVDDDSSPRALRAVAA